MRLALWFGAGEVLTEAQVADRLGVSEEAAAALLDLLAWLVPIYDDEAGCWRCVEK